MRFQVICWLFLCFGLIGPLSVAPCAANEVGELSEQMPPELSDLVRVWSCRFTDEKWDVNYDEWPDRWTRVYDDEHPQYVQIGIEPIADREIPGRRLVLRPDGASALATSPPIHVMPKFSYKLRMRVKVDGARNGQARVRLAFHDHNNEVRQIEQTEPLESDGEWHSMDFGDFQPVDDEVDRVYVHVDYERGERGDLAAEVSVADLRLYRLPSIKISTGSRYNVYTDPSNVKVTCSLSGILEQNPEIRFQLLDATNKSIGDGGALELDGKIISESRSLASDIVDGYGSDKSSYEGAIDWRPPIQDYGFYRVRVGMFRAGTDIPVGDSRSITVAVVREELEASEQGEFGWSLPRGDRPLSFPVLQELLPRVGVRMVKLPVWFEPGDEQRGEEIMRFTDQLAARGIEAVGVLEDPTHWKGDPLSEAEPPPIEGLLSAHTSYWTPLIDHIITRLSLRIRWWQLGRDGDTSFVGYDKLVEKMGAIRNQMFRFGQDIRLGIGWRWDHGREWRQPLAWDFEQMSGREQLNAAGLEEALSNAPPTTAQRWVLVAPPNIAPNFPPEANPKDPDDPYVRQALVQSHQRRVRDFVEQILIAKMNGADGIFITNPFSGSADSTSGDAGVMNDDGTPGELLLPWRTCARLLGGADYLGSVQLPSNSHNWLFRRPDGRVVMVLWNLDIETEDANETPVEEVLYLGERVQVIDIWGASVKPEVREGRQVVRVGRMPRFVMGLHEGIALWRMQTSFEHVAVPSVFGSALQNALVFENTFGQGVGVEMRIVVPDRSAQAGVLSDESSSEWEMSLDQERLSLAASEAVRAPLEITLREASYGPQPVRIDFNVVADRDYRFSVWRELRVGLDDVTLQVNSYLGEDGRLLIEQQMRKTSGEPSDFKCLLYAPDRRRKRALVFQLGKEVDRKRYTYLNSDGLIGAELRLRVEEQDGQRILIHRFTVDPKPLSVLEEELEDDGRIGEAEDEAS